MVSIIYLLKIKNKRSVPPLPHKNRKSTHFSSVSDPYHFDADPDPRIRFQDDGSGSDQISNKFQFFSS